MTSHRRLTLPLTCRCPNETVHGQSEPQPGSGQVERSVYARHGRELMGCKSPVGGSPSCIAKYMKTTTSPRQGRHREVGSEGSRRRRCEARNTNGIEGSLPWDELAQHSKVPWTRGSGKCRACAATTHVLIRGELPCVLGSGGPRKLTERERKPR
jgi:hypothetical protein